MKLPRYTATKEDYPHIHKDHDGRAVPEILGKTSLLAANSAVPGSVEAVFVDTTTHEYLCAAGSLHAVPEVYANGKLVSAANYDIVYKDGGRTYIDFATSKAGKVITFNAEGYMYANWNSANGYVQNPAYIMLFFWAFLCEAAQEDLDIDAFIQLAAYYVAKGWDEAGKLPMQDFFERDAWLQQMLFSFGAKHWPANDGRMTVGRIGPTDFASVPTIFIQTDTLTDPEKPRSLDQLINRADYVFDFHPAALVHQGSGLVEQLDSQEIYGIRQPSTPWAFPCITDEAMAEERAREEISRLAYGKRQANFPLPFCMVEDYDLLTPFKLQDPFGVNALGAGDPDHPYFVTGITQDPQRNRIEIVADDAEWLLAAYDEENVPVVDEDGEMVYFEVD